MKKKIVSLLLIISFLSTSCKKERKIDYTFNTYIKTSLASLNNHNKLTDDDKYISSFTSMGLYSKDYDGIGYKYNYEYATSYPEKVESSFLTDEEKSLYYEDIGNPVENSIYDINLRPDVKFSNGSDINASTYIDSMRYLLDSKYNNYKASTFTSSYPLINAKEYNTYNRYILTSYYDIYQKNEDFTPSDGNYYLNVTRANSIISNLFSSNTEASLYTLIYNSTFDKKSEVSLKGQRIIDASIYYLAYAFFSYYDSIRTDNKKRFEHNDETSSYITFYKNNEEFYTEHYEDWLNLINVDDASIVDNVTYSMLENMPSINLVDFDNHNISVRIEADNNIIDSNNSQRYYLSTLLDDMNYFISSISSSESYKLLTFVNYKNTKEISFDKVGIRKIDDYKIRLYFKKSISAETLMDILEDNFLVDPSLYDNLTKENDVRKVTEYQTGKIDNYNFYGPYKIDEIDNDKVVLVKNDNFYSIYDENSKYKADKIIINYISSNEEANSKFLKGELDYLYNDESLSNYQKSSSLTYLPKAAIERLSFNSDYDSLIYREKEETGNKNILANKNFRKAFSLAINRDVLISNSGYNMKPTSTLITPIYLSDSKSGESYRSTNYGESVSSTLDYNLKKESEHNEENISDGYNFILSLDYLYKTIKEELNSDKISKIKKGDKIVLDALVKNDRNANDNIRKLKLIQNQFSKVFDSLNNKLLLEETITSSELFSFEINIVLTRDYENKIKRGEYDILLSTSEGNYLNPYSFMNLFASSSYSLCLEYSFKGKQNEEKMGVDLNNDGKISDDEIKTYQEYLNLMNNNYNDNKYSSVSLKDDEYKDYSISHDMRLKILSSIEYNILARYETVPLSYKTTSYFLSKKVSNYSSKYNPVLNYTSHNNLIFNYLDTKWNDYLKENNNNLQKIYLS